MGIKEGPFMRIRGIGVFFIGSSAAIDAEFADTDFPSYVQTATFALRVGIESIGQPESVQRYGDCSVGEIDRYFKPGLYQIESPDATVEPLPDTWGAIFGSPNSIRAITYFEGNRECDGLNFNLWDKLDVHFFARDLSSENEASICSFYSFNPIGKQIIFERDDVPGQMERYTIVFAGPGTPDDVQLIEDGGPHIGKEECVEDEQRIIDNLVVQMDFVLLFDGVEPS